MEYPRLFNRSLVEVLGPRLAFVAEQGLAHLMDGPLSTLLSRTDEEFAELVCSGLYEEYTGGRPPSKYFPETEIKQ